MLPFQFCILNYLNAIIIQNNIKMRNNQFKNVFNLTNTF